VNFKINLKIHHNSKKLCIQLGLLFVQKQWRSYTIKQWRSYTIKQWRSYTIKQWRSYTINGACTRFFP